MGVPRAAPGRAGCSCSPAEPDKYWSATPCPKSLLLPQLTNRQAKKPDRYWCAPRAVKRPGFQPRERAMSGGLNFARICGIGTSWRRERGRLLLGAESPFSSWTRDPASTPYCCHGRTRPGARLIDFEDEGPSRRHLILEVAQCKFCIRAARGLTCIRTWSWPGCAV